MNCDKQNLRLGLSKTYTLPQFKERAPFIYEEVQVKVEIKIYTHLMIII
jgi:hypothetical protein